MVSPYTLLTKGTQHAVLVDREITLPRVGQAQAQHLTLVGWCDRHLPPARLGHGSRMPAAALEPHGLVWLQVGRLAHEMELCLAFGDRTR